MEPAVLVLALASAMAGLVPCWAMARFLSVRAGWVVAGFLAVAVAGFILAAQSAQGMEGLGYIVLAMIFAAPAGLGAALGTALGGWMRVRAAGQGAA